MKSLRSAPQGSVSFGPLSSPPIPPENSDPPISPDNSEPVIFDNTAAGFSTVGSWGTSSSTSGYYGSNYRYAGPGNGSRQATWSFSISAGITNYRPNGRRMKTGPPTPRTGVYNNGVEIGTQIFDQRVNGGRFNVFDTSYVVEDGTLDVVLTDDANGYVIGDAVRVVFLD